MTLTRWAFTTLDRIDGSDQALANALADHADADLLCYRADAPAELVALEAEAWDPLLAWAEQSLGLIFVVTRGVVHRPQPEATLARVASLARGLDPFRRTGLAFAAGLFGSAILAFALSEGRLGGEAAFDLSRLDEAYQAARWGVDAEAATRTASLRQDARTLQLWFNLL
jgi:chaperone required for assembly of F1-ATPase